MALHCAEPSNPNTSLRTAFAPLLEGLLNVSCFCAGITLRQQLAAAELLAYRLRAPAALNQKGWPHVATFMWSSFLRQAPPHRMWCSIAANAIHCSGNEFKK